MNPPAPTITIALAGQPNTGKTTVFNSLTHQAQYVSNWPGKTIELCKGVYRQNGNCFEIVDLPGAYSLTANSEEERLARDYLLFCKPDVIVAIVDAGTLERNLYLVAELLMLRAPLVIGLNMVDVAEQSGVHVEPHVLEAALGLPVVPMNASKGQGVQNLMAAALKLAADPSPAKPNRPAISSDHQLVLEQITTLIAGRTPDPYPQDWVALKLLEGDTEVTNTMMAAMGEDWKAVYEILLKHEDAFLAVASGRYEWIGRMVRAAVLRPKAGQLTITDRIDRFATHPILGIGVLLGILGLMFWLTYSVGAPLQSWLETDVIGAGSSWARAEFVELPPWVLGVLLDGVVAGVGTVLTLLPVLGIFFLVFGLMEDIGYMARAAYVMDRFMHLMGLHGKSFLPVFLGFGCNVPAILGSRIVDPPKARLITILVTPLVPCTARLSVLVLLTPIFFGSAAIWVSLGLLAGALALLMILGIVLHEFFLGGEHTVFIMELPLYHQPNWKIILGGVWTRVVDFLKGAGSIILVVSVLMWALSTYPGGNIDSSYLSVTGHFMAPLGKLMGMDWQMMVALLTSFVRKENTIPTLAVLYNASGTTGGLAGALSGSLTSAAALSFLAVQMLFVPCVATVAAIRQETRSWKWTFVSIGLLFVLSMTVGILIYQGAGWLGWGQ